MMVYDILEIRNGSVPKRLKGAVLKTARPGTVPGFESQRFRYGQVAQRRLQVTVNHPH